MGRFEPKLYVVRRRSPRGRPPEGETAGAVASDDRLKGWRVLVDHVADFWTVVFEASFEDVDDYFAVISSPEARAEMEGYLELVESGGRRLFRLAAEG